MSRVWAYIIGKKLSTEELNSLKDAGNLFVLSWTAHERQLTASFEIFKDRIIIVKVNIELLNRLIVAYKNDNEVEVVHSSKIKELLSENKISENTVIYNTSILTQNELNTWEQPLKETWLNKYISEKI